MKKKFSGILLVFGLFLPVCSFALNGNSLWQKVEGDGIPSKGIQQITPQKSIVYLLDVNALKSWMSGLSALPEEGQVLSLPMPDGTFREFRVWQTPMMQPLLAAKYSEIKTFTAYALDDKFVTAKLDFTTKGFHAMFFDGDRTCFIDPYSNVNDGYCQCYYKNDLVRSVNKVMECAATEQNDLGLEEIHLGIQEPKAHYKLNGTVQRTYRLALACTYEYAVAVAGATPTKADVLSAMVTSMNRVNGVYEREVAVTMTLINNTDTLINLTSADPYTNGNGGQMLSENQTVVDDLIGTANYDMGHVFSTGGGGVAMFGICDDNLKAQGVTGSSNPVGDAFDIDYVAHEMGHQFHADHTFNANTGSCNGNGVSNSAYEPGSGTTIMAYAGICGGGNDMQQHSDDYFHARSLVQISNCITTGDGATCGTTAVTANVPPSLPVFTAVYAIPYLTPFELIAPTVADIDHDSLKYCWEQWQLGNFKSSWANTNARGPIFRSFLPTTSDTRIFPKLAKLLANTISYSGEKLSDTDRFLRFKLTVRDMLNGWGTFNFPDDTIHLDVINTGAPFAVTYPNAAISWTGNTSETITWDVSGTTASPINCSSVDIYISTDGGYTYTLLKGNTPNDGSEIVTVPNTPTTTARIKIKATGNVFFDISNLNFTILPDASNVRTVVWQNVINVYPVPASKELNVSVDYAKQLNVDITTTLGQHIWSGVIKKQLTIPVDNWAHGMYYLQLSEPDGGQKVTRKIVVE